jgi:2'-5' RNA ligase
MSNLVIVAIPERDDPVWEISSEEVPHLTLLFLGESSQAENVTDILGFLHHAAKTTLHRFSLEVDHRGTLGDDEADVVFFEGWDLPDLKRFRGNLLQNDNIKKAYLSAEQHPEWLPHLTLGYPQSPAKESKDPYRRIYSVQFDRVALWVNDYSGPEFQLKKYEYPEVSMSDLDPILGPEFDKVLSHYGVKGMKWGVRRSNRAASKAAKKEKKNTPTDVVVTSTPKGKAKTSGGKNQPTHPDAVKARVAVQKAKKSGLDSLSNQELQVLARRLELERKVSSLADDQMASNGKKFLDIALAVS